MRRFHLDISPTVFQGSIELFAIVPATADYIRTRRPKTLRDCMLGSGSYDSC